VYRTEKRFLVPDVIVVDQSAVVGSGVDPSVVHLAVEIVSPSTELMDRGLKAELYAELGVPAYWVLDQDGAQVPFERPSAFESPGAPWMVEAYAAFRSSWSARG
jgi:Uma2 family endonuclease